jgi:hypothetical protein
MNADTLLLRQAHPQFVPDGQISSQAFFPFPKDDGLLSVDDGDQITAAQAYLYYTTKLNLESCGVWAVTKAEVTGESLAALSTPEPERPSHASVDFRGKSEKECRKIAKKLKAKAHARGCLHIGHQAKQSSV